MNIYAWIGLSAIVLFTLLPFINKKHRTKENTRQAIVTVIIVAGLIIAILVFNVSYFTAIVAGAVAMILADKKTYTKKRLIIYGIFIALASLASFMFFRQDPDYVLKHLEKNPESTSLYVAHNGETEVAYQADQVRPLASTVKVVIALEYAIQVAEGKLDKNKLVSLDELDRLYIKNTDGGAHEAWLEEMKSKKKITNNQVTLHDVAKGMITYSSNANTDYLIHLLGMSAINERIKELELQKHEEIYPLVGSLLIPTHVKTKGMSEEELLAELEQMPMSTYRSLAKQLGEQLQTERAPNDLELSQEVQRIWSNRLIGASATEYGKLMALISNDKLPSSANEIMRDILEWPMEVNKENKSRFQHLGMKGGSTLFIHNQALYAQTLSGDRAEIVLLMNDLSMWESLRLGRSVNSFLSKLIDNEDYQAKVQEALEGTQ